MFRVIQENRALLEKLGSMKSTVDNKEPKGNINLRIRAKERVTKND